jgi:hypothetical protein
MMTITTPLTKDVTPDFSFLTFPFFNSLNSSPDASKTVFEVIQTLLYDHYKYLNIATDDVDIFKEELQRDLYNYMLLKQYVLGEFVRLLESEQFFYNTEDTDISGNEVVSGDNSSNSTNNTVNKFADTPQVSLGTSGSQLNNMYMSQYTSNEATITATGTTGNNTDNTQTIHTRKSMLGDVIQRFERFSEFPNFWSKLILATADNFIVQYSLEDL